MQGRWLRVIPAIAGVAVLAGVLWLAAPLVLQRVALDGDWRLEAGMLDGSPIPVLTDHRPTLTIDGGRVSGNAACNDYGGYLDVSGTSAHPHDIFWTVGRCLDDAQMASEAAFLAALERVTKVRREGEHLVLAGPSVEMRFEPIPSS
jgi:heat shock protein HslJ